MGVIRTREIPYEESLEGVVNYVYTNENDPSLNRNVPRYAVADNHGLLPYLLGHQTTESESHTKWLGRKTGRFTGDLGGPFETTKHHYASPTARVKLNGYINYGYNNKEQQVWGYNGPMFPLHPSQCGFPGSYATSDDDLAERGTTAIARCSPSHPTTDLSTAIGEIFHDGIPAVVGGTLKAWRDLSARDRRRAIGKEHLNVEFGWKPLINDLRKTAKSILHANEILSQYERDSGKLVRRSYDFPDEVLEYNNYAQWGNISPYIDPSVGEYYDYPNLNKGQVLVSAKITRKQWFRGAFSYYVPPADGLRNSIARHVIQARKLLGISLTPDTVWNLAPWSWAVDWFFNVGDVLSNWTDWAIDNQVLMYGYMMEHSITTNTYTFVGPTGYLPAGQRPMDMVFVSETKKRIKATPYGFGVSWDSLTNRQLAIIAALGISRSK